MRFGRALLFMLSATTAGVACGNPFVAVPGATGGAGAGAGAGPTAGGAAPTGPTGSVTGSTHSRTNGSTVIGTSATSVTVVSSGCRGNADCNSTEYCRFPDHECGDAGAGICTATPGTCLQPAVTPPPMCGCTGKWNAVTSCGLAALRTDMGIAGQVCPMSGEPGYFACGVVACTPTNSYCLNDEACVARDFCGRSVCSCGASSCGDAGVRSCTGSDSAGWHLYCN